ncbi:unnamed protein product, partial [Brassica rapa subsp. narinosa]
VPPTLNSSFFPIQAKTAFDTPFTLSVLSLPLSTWFGSL